MVKDSLIFTDKYELTMGKSYSGSEAVFDLFVRRLPEHRGYLISAGLEQVIDFLTETELTEDERRFLKKENLLKGFAEGCEVDVRAMPEGTVFFPNEPVLEVKGPIEQAQRLETYLINQINYQSNVATKASRIRKVAGERNVVEFGARRAQGTDAALKAARSAYIGGFDGTSLVKAGKEFGIPLFGTMAHSLVQSRESEKEAFRDFLEENPNSILLVETYNLKKGVKNAIEVAREKEGIKGVRVDSGDLAERGKIAENIIKAHGLGSEIEVFLSGGLDEFKIKEIQEKYSGAAGYGVGTKLVTCQDSPSLDTVYKLVESNGKPKMKLSPGKKTYPCEKQVWRVEEEGMYKKDIVGTREEDQKGRPLLVDVIKEGKLVYKEPSLKEIREKAQKELKMLPREIKRIKNPQEYEVEISPTLKNVTSSLEEKLRDKYE